MARLEAHSTHERIPVFTLTNGISPPRPSDLRSAVQRFSSACAHRAILPTDPASVDLLLSLSPDQQAILTSMPAPADVFMAPLLPRISVPATYAPLDLLRGLHAPQDRIEDLTFLCQSLPTASDLISGAQSHTQAAFSLSLSLSGLACLSVRP